MKVLLDVAVSPRLRRPLQERLEGAVVETAVFREWRSLRDDRLLAEAGQHGFTTLLTTDRRMAGEQRHPDIAIVAVDDNRIPRLIAAASAIADAIRSTRPGESCLVPVARAGLGAAGPPASTESGT